MDKQTQDWKKFIAWRKKKLNKLQESKEMKSLQKEYDRTVEIWLSTDPDDWLRSKQYLNLNDPEEVLLEQKLFLSEIPEETYENFLNWKAGLYD